MNASDSIELIGQLAGAEAIAGRFVEIQPEHFCMGLLEFWRLSVNQNEEVVGEEEATRAFVAQIQSLRGTLTRSSIQTPLAR